MQDPAICGRILQVLGRGYSRDVPTPSTPTSSASPGATVERRALPELVAADWAVALEPMATRISDLGDFLRAVPEVREVSIGHAFIADALELGYAATTREYLRCIAEAGR